MFPDLTQSAVPFAPDNTINKDREAHWIVELSRVAQERKATAAATKTLTPTETEEMARQVFADIAPKAFNEGIDLSPRKKELILRLIGELSGLGQLLELIASPEVEDIAVNMGHIYVYKTKEGWVYAGPATSNIGSGLRVLIDRAGQRAPTPEYPIADAMLQVMVPGPD